MPEQDYNSELELAYRKFEKARDAGDTENAKSFANYARELEAAMDSQEGNGGALADDTPQEQSAFDSEQPEQAAPRKGGFVKRNFGGGVKGLVEGIATGAQSYLSTREMEHQQHSALTQMAIDGLPDGMRIDLEEHRREHPEDREDFGALSNYMEERWGKDFSTARDSAVQEMRKDPNVSKVMEGLYGSKASTGISPMQANIQSSGYKPFNIYDKIIRPFFSKNGPDLAKNMEGWVKDIREQYTPDELASSEKPYIAEDAELTKPSTWFKGTKMPWEDFNGFWLDVMRNTPQLAASYGASRAGGSLGARAALRSVGGAAKAEIGAAGKAIEIGSTIGGMVGGTITEGVMIRDQVAQQTYQQLIDLPEEAWDSSADYQSFRNQGMNDTEARQMVARDISLKAGNTAMVFSGALGAPTSAYFGRIASRALSKSFVSGVAARVGGALEGTVAEAVPEGAQGLVEQFITNVGVRKVDPHQSLTDQLGNAALGSGMVAGPMGMVGGALQSHRAPGLSKEQNEVMAAMRPFRKAADERWKHQNKISEDDWDKSRSATEQLQAFNKLEDLQQTEAKEFLKSEPELRKYLINKGSDDESLKRLDIMRASANRQLNLIERARRERGDASKAVETARKQMKEREEIAASVENDFLKLNDIDRLVNNIETIRNKGGVQRADYEDLIQRGYGKYTNSGANFMITAKGIRALKELKQQRKNLSAKISGLYTGEERRSDAKTRERMSNMSSEQFEEAVYRDSVTGTLNRRAFDEAEAETEEGSAEPFPRGQRVEIELRDKDTSAETTKQTGTVEGRAKDGRVNVRVGDHSYIIDEAELTAIDGQESDEALSDEERARLGFRRPRVGKAEAKSAKPKAYAEVDVDSLKWVNDNMSVEAGDKLLKRVAEVLNEQEGVTAYRVGEDEDGTFVVTGESPEALEQAMQQASIELDDSRVITHENDAVMPQMTWAVGASREEASERMKHTTGERETKGKRAARGDKPPSYRNVTQGIMLHAGEETAASRVIKKIKSKLALRFDEAPLTMDERNAALEQIREEMVKQRGRKLTESEREHEAQEILEAILKDAAKSKVGRVLMHSKDYFDVGLSEDGLISFHLKEGGYPRAEDKTPGVMPKHQLVVPKALFDQMPDLIDTISFVMDKNGQTALPSMEASEVYEFLMRMNGLDSDNAVASITHVLQGGTKLRVGTIVNMRNTRSTKSTVSVRAFNSMLQGINMLANDIDAGNIAGNPAYALYPTRELEREERRLSVPVQGNIFNDYYDMSRDDEGRLSYPSWYGAKSRGVDAPADRWANGYRNWSSFSNFTPYNPSNFTPYNWKPVYVIDRDTIDLLKTKRLVAIWCNADDFFKTHKLSGFSTGMFVSEMAEARIMKVDGATQAEVDQSNDLFSYVANKHIDLDGEALYDAILSDYARLGGENIVVKYNIKEMEEARGVIKASTRPAAPLMTRRDLLKTLGYAATAPLLPKFTSSWPKVSAEAARKAREYGGPMLLRAKYNGFKPMLKSEIEKAIAAVYAETDPVKAEAGAAFVEANQEYLDNWLKKKLDEKAVNEAARPAETPAEKPVSVSEDGKKTLVIHPDDSSTDFLKPIYAGHPDWTIVTGDKHLGEIKELIQSHDRIIMMGHGSPQGLMGVSQFEDAPSPAAIAAIEAGKPEVAEPKQNTVPKLPRANEQTMERANKVKADITTMLGNRLPVIHMHASAEDIPPSVAQRILADGTNSMFGVRGFFDEEDGSIHVVVGNITKGLSGYNQPGNLMERSIAETIFHELVGHYGLRGLIGDQDALDVMTAELREGFPDDERLRVNQMAQQKNMSPEDVRKNPVLMSMVGEEIFAYRAGELLSQRYVGMSRQQRSVFNRAIDKLRQWLVKHGFGRWIRMNERDLIALVAHAERFIRKGSAWRFLNRNGVRQLVEMRDANIFQSGLRRIIEHGVQLLNRNGVRQPNWTFTVKASRLFAESKGEVVPKTIPLFNKESGSIRYYLDAFKFSVTTKQLTQLELDESAVVETLLPNPVAWALQSLNMSEEMFAKNTGIPLEYLKTLMVPGTQIPDTIAEKIANYLRTPGLLSANVHMMTRELGIKYTDSVAELGRRHTGSSDELHVIATKEIEDEWRKANHGRLSAKAFQLGTAMTYRDLQSLMARMRTGSAEPDYSDLDVFKEILPSAMKEKIDDFMGRLEAAKKARRKRPDRDELNAILNNVVDPSKVSFSREMMRNIVEESALSEVLVWPVEANPVARADAYKRVTGTDPPDSWATMDPIFRDKVEAELALMREDGYDAGYDPNLNQWFGSPIHQSATGHRSLTPFGQGFNYQVYLFWEKRAAQGRWASGHFGGKLPSKHEAKISPGARHISHIRIGLADDGDPNASAAPNPAMTGKALAGIEFQSDAFQRTAGGFRDDAEMAQANEERALLLNENKVAMRNYVSTIGVAIADAVRAKVAAARIRDGRIDADGLDNIINTELLSPLIQTFAYLKAEYSALQSLTLSRVDVRAIERINALPIYKFMEHLRPAIELALTKVKQGVGVTAYSDEVFVQIFKRVFNSETLPFINTLDNPDQPQTYAMNNPAQLGKTIDRLFGFIDKDISKKAMAAAETASSTTMTIPASVIGDPELDRLSMAMHGGSTALTLTQNMLNYSAITSSKHNGLAYGRIIANGDVEISYVGSDPDDFKRVYKKSLKEMLQAWASTEFIARQQAVLRSPVLHLERKPTIEEFYSWLGLQETDNTELRTRYDGLNPYSILHEGKMPIKWDDDGNVTEWTSVIVKTNANSRMTRIYLGFESNADNGYSLIRANDRFKVGAQGSYSDDTVTADPIPEFVKAVKRFAAQNSLTLKPEMMPWREGVPTGAEPQKDMNPIADGIMSGALFVNNEVEKIDPPEVAKRLRLLTARLASGVQPNSIMGRSDRWKIAQLRFLISHAVRNGIPKIQWATGDASTTRGGGWTSHWESYDRVTWSVEPLVFNGEAKDYIIIRAVKNGAASSYAVTKDNLPVLVGADAALYIEQQLAGKKPPVRGGTVEPSRADLTVFTMGDMRFVTRRGRSQILASIRANEDLDAKLDELVATARSAPNGWVFAETGVADSSNDESRWIIKAFEDKGQPWGEVHQDDIGGPIQILKYEAGRDWGTDALERMELLGARTSYDTILPRIFGKEIKKYGGVLKRGSMKINRMNAKDARNNQGMHRAVGIVPSNVQIEIGTPEVRHLTGDTDGYVITGKDGLLDNVVYATQQEAQRAINTIVAERDQTAVTPVAVSVWEFEITDEMRRVFGQPVSPFMFDPYSDPLIKGAADKIGGREPSFKERYSQWRMLWKDAFIQGALDRFHGIKRALNEAGQLEVDAEFNGYIQTRLSTSLDAMMKSVMLYGHPVWRDGIMQTEGEGLKDVLGEVADKLDLWAMYMAGVRAKRLLTGGDEALWREVINPKTSAARKAEIIKSGREKLFTPEQIERMAHLDEVYPGFKRTAERYAAFHKNVLDFAQKAGTINPETRVMWENADYIPFYRVQDDRIIGPMSSTSGIANVSSPIKTLKGGTDNTGDLMHNIMINLTKLVDGAVKNHAALTTVDALRPHGIISHQPLAYSKELIPLDQVKKLLIERGMDPDTIPAEALKGFQSMFALKAPKGDGIISVMRDGKKEFYYTDDVLLYRAMTAINKQHFGKWMRVLRAPKRLLTTWITLDPAFMIANYIRDALSSFVISRDNVVPMVGGVVGFAKAMANSEEMRIMMSAGAAFENGYINQYDPEATKRLMKRTLASAKPGDIILDSPVKLYELWKRIGSASENANRIAVYSAAIAAGKSKAQAVYESKDLMDFSMSGDWPVIQFLVQTVPFLGARIQGLHRLGRSFNENPISTIMKGTLVGLAGLALWLAYRDDERYKDLEDWDKDTYFHFWIGDNHYRLPKPFEVGAIFNTIPERIFEYFYSNENDAGQLLLRRFGWMLTQTFNMNPTPQAIQPILEGWFNKNTFTGNQIETPYEEQRLPPERYRTSTSPVMIELARHLPAELDTLSGKIRSPLQLQNLYLGYTGTLGRYFLLGADALIRESMDLPRPPEKVIGEYPVVGRFARGNTPQRTRYEEEFYNLLRKTIQVQGSVKFLEKASEDERLDYIEGKYEPYIAISKEMDKASERISKFNKDMRDVWMDRDMTPEQKRKEIDEIQLSRNEVFKDYYQLRPGGRDNPLPPVTNEQVRYFIEQFNGGAPPKELMKTAPATAELLTDVGALPKKQLLSLAKTNGASE